MANSQTFSLKTAAAGLTDAVNTNGVAVADYDGDGDLDAYFVAVKQYDPIDPTTWNRLYRNNGNGTFSDMTIAAGVSAVPSEGYTPGPMGNKFGASWGDYDRDGDPDLFLSQVGPDILYRNNGDGSFSDVTAEAGVAGLTGPDDNFADASALWWDHDLDGDLDLYVSSWTGANRMYRNLGNGSFQDISVESGLADEGRTWSSVPLDVNDDGLLDLYVVNDFGANRFYVNHTDSHFTEETAAYGLEDIGNGMGVAVGDYDNNGTFDIYVTNISYIFSNPLFSNDGRGHFTDVAEQVGVSDPGWSWGTEFFDADHDGDQDLYVATGFVDRVFTNHFFSNTLFESSHPVFKDVSNATNTADPNSCRAMAVFDYDNDGDLDMLVANWFSAPTLLENEMSEGNWLKMQLKGTVSNTDGFGASIMIRSGGKNQYRYNDAVDYLQQSPQPLHVGLGLNPSVDDLVVTWPGGYTESFGAFNVNQTVTLVEGSGRAVATDVAIEDLPGSVHLSQNFPNPFAGKTEIRFSLDQAGPVRLELIDLMGRPIRTVIDEFRSTGTHDVTIHADRLPAGMYLYRLTTSRGATNRSMTVLR